MLGQIERLVEDRQAVIRGPGAAVRLGEKAEVRHPGQADTGRLLLLQPVAEQRDPLRDPALVHEQPAPADGEEAQQEGEAVRGGDPDAGGDVLLAGSLEVHCFLCTLP